MSVLRPREAIEEIEASTLAPYAQRSAAGRGRLHPQDAHHWRTEYQRDVSRIIHSAAFRRLEYKTQVFLNGTGDHYRTRLTHTMEVASISRTLARALGLNEDLAEAVALAHDLGHSPFGHSGEETLDRLLKDHGGFDHNDQSLRVVTLLESPYDEFDGLNLTFEVLEGVQKHASERSAPGIGSYACASLEGQIADLADEIAYYSHDLQDGLEAGLILAGSLHQVELCAMLAAEHGLDLDTAEARSTRHNLARILSNRLIHGVLTESAGRIAASGVQSADDVRRHPDLLIGYSPSLEEQTKELRSFLYANLYFHPQVAGANQRACDMMAAVFGAYLQDPRRIGREATRRVPNCGLYRAAGDYIAGMTDRYLLREHGRIFSHA
ncbi:MAG: deoxyguanosinetriphosphate triphosphohydrolase [Chthoniobacterales bacterium]|nr:deoxyguanosinetriphosphate triphosphohydrolase [Chthoniobacterales bacterium]